MLIAGCKLRCRPVALALFGMVLLVVAGLGACTPYQVSDRSMSFNGSLGDLDNRQVLLNAVRASKRYPPYYTAVAGITSTGELDGSQINFSLPFGPVSHSNNSVSPMIKVGTGITMTTNPLDTQDFYEGYMAPVKPDLIGYYLNYGWPTQLVVHTFVREIDLPRDIVKALQIRLKHLLETELQRPCTTSSGQFTALIVDQGQKIAAENVAGCLDNLSYPPLMAQMLIAQSTNDQTGRCPSFEALNTLKENYDYSPVETVAAGRALAAYNVAKSAGTVAKGSAPDIVRFINDPSNHCRFATFQLMSAMLDKLELSASSTPPKTNDKTITVPTSQTGMSIKIQNDASSETAKVNFVLNKVTDPCALANKTATPHAGDLPKDTVVANPMQLTVSGYAPSAAATKAADEAAAKPGKPAAGKPAEPAAAGPAEPAAAGPREPAAAKPAKPVKLAAPAKPKKTESEVQPWQTFCSDEGKIQIVPRSPEAIVFYLGQLIENENPERGTPFIAWVRGVSASHPLFDVRKGDPGDAEVSVSLDGETYSIPRGPAFESTMHMLTLTEQVIGLQKKGTQIPGIVPVQVINP